MKSTKAAKRIYGYADFYRGIGASIMGTRTYEKALGLAGGIDRDMPTYVITNRALEAPAGANITFYSGDLAQLVSDLREKTKKNLWRVGGGLLAQSFLREGLVDLIILSIIPVLLGDGVSLFGNLRKEIALRLVEAKSYESGIVQSHYRIVRRGA